MAREAAKVAREEESAEKAAQRVHEKEAHNAAKASQSSHKGKRKFSQPSVRRNKLQRRVVDTVAPNEVSGAASTAPPKTTRRGRNVRLSDRYP